MAKDEAVKANRDLKSQTVSNWDFLLNISDMFYEGLKSSVLFKNLGIGPRGERDPELT